jgi:DNA helicase II / ATP-dependent DNA helicase PcrA
MKMQAKSVYGPPGTGKTTELLRRLEECKSRGFSPEDIIYVSFTKAGANEALKRLNIKRADTICTIHSLMYRMTNVSPGQVVDLPKLREFAKVTGFEFSGAGFDNLESMGIGDRFMAIFQRSVARGTLPSEEYAESDRPGSREDFRVFCQGYHKWKRNNGYVDYSDMLQRYIDKPTQHKGRVLMVDEAQDLSDQQWQVIDTLIENGPVEEAHIAGDDDQAVFEWSGANPHGMARFEEKYKAERLILNVSHRVPRKAQALALEVIQRIRNRVHKDYEPRNIDGDIKVYSALTGNMLRNKPSLVLCRSNNIKGDVEHELIKHRVPYANEGGRPGLFDNAVAKAIRGIQKMQKEEPLSRADIEAVQLLANQDTKNLLERRDFAAVAKKGHERSIRIPFNLIEFYRSVDLAQQPQVKLSTIHGAKGREHDHVVLHLGLTSRILNGIHTNPDQEARVFYVGLTRCRDGMAIIDDGAGYKLDYSGGKRDQRRPDLPSEEKRTG